MMLKRSYVVLLNLILSILIVPLSVKAARIWLSSEQVKEEKSEEKNFLAKVEKPETMKKARPSLADYQVIEEQNLFHNTRKTPKEAPPPATTQPVAEHVPTPPPTPTPQPEIVNPPNVSFYGTGQEGADTYALIQGKSDQRPQKYRLNEEVDGYTVIEIRRNQVILSRHGKDFPIKLWELNAAKKGRGGPVQQPNMPQPMIQQPPNFQQPNMPQPVIQQPPNFQQPNMPQPVIQQPPNFQQPNMPQVGIQQPGFLPTPIAPGTYRGINKGRPAPYPSLPPGQQFPQPINPGGISPGQGRYMIEQPPPEFVNPPQELDEQEFQDSEDSEEEAPIQPGGIQPGSPNMVSPNMPGMPLPTPTPFVIPRINP